MNLNLGETRLQRPFPLFVSWHAQQRYILRVCADVSDVRYAVREMWRQSYTATQADLECARPTPHEGDIYRVGRGPNGLRYLMIMRNQCIVTILNMR